MDTIRPIRTDADYDWAMAEIARYFETEPETGSPEAKRFDLLATLIEAYENETYPISMPDPVEVIRAHMELFGLSRQALAEVIGSSPRASEILNRRRKLTVDMIHRLSREWHIPADILVQPYRLAGAMPDA